VHRLKPKRIDQAETQGELKLVQVENKACAQLTKTKIDPKQTKCVIYADS
jgi:hypothetical protein